jgi:hypothetical protein
MKREFSGQIFEKLSSTNFHKILPVGAELFHVDRRRDMMKLSLFLLSSYNPQWVFEFSTRSCQADLSITTFVL